VKVLLIFMVCLGCVVSGFLLGYIMASSVNTVRAARRNGFSQHHRNIYKRAIGSLNKIVNAHALDADMDPLLQRVSLPESLRSEAEKVLEDYRKEINA